MKIKLQKIIAREFLYLLFASILSLIFIFIFSQYENSILSKKDNLTKLKESDTLAYRLHFYYRTKKISESNNLNDIKYINEISKISGFPEVNNFIEKVKVPNVYNNIWNSASKYYEMDRKEDQKFIKKIQRDVNNSENLLSKIKVQENELLSLEESFFGKRSNLGIIVIIIFSALFALRFLIYATIWSVKTLKN